EFGNSWAFVEPSVTGQNVSLNILGTVTNTACGNTYDATRIWLLSDDLGFRATCSQTVHVTDSTPPAINCVPDKTIAAGEDWSFDLPIALDVGTAPKLAYDNFTNNLEANLDTGANEVGNEIFFDGSTGYPVQFSLV